MASWRDGILRDFQPKISRLTLVADPDGLLTEERMLSAIKDRGFDLIPFDDPIAFRFAYESQYRSLWDNGQESDLVVVLRSEDQQLSKLPFDLLKAGRPIVLALHHLFPKLNYPVIAGLDRCYLDAIDDAYKTHDGETLTEKATKDFVLMHCFRIVPPMIRTSVDLMKILLSLHSRKQQLPELLVEHLFEKLQTNTEFADWPLRKILQSRESFLSFVQTQWCGFLKAWTKNIRANGLAAGGSANAAISVGESGPENLIPFHHEDIRAYVDTLFLDGSLTPVETEDAASLPSWAQTGVIHDASADSLRRFHGLRMKLDASLPEPGASHRDWQDVAQKWAELVVLRWICDEMLGPDERQLWTTLHERIEREFGRWMTSRYGTLHNLPHQHQPAMVHHIPRFMALERKRKKLSRVALVVLDGLALDQWLLLKKQLDDSCSGLRFHESTAFAWVPTLTSVTRQSIFAGEPPLYFPDSLGTTSKERSHWQRFWEDQGVTRSAIELVTNIEGAKDPKLEASLSDPRLSVLGIVWNKVDDIMHGMQMQTAGMHNQVKLWASQGHLQQLLKRLHDEQFTVYLTADHGNVTAAGVGNPREGVLAEIRGKRCRVYDRPEFREEVAEQYPDSIRWPGYGLPVTQHVLLAGDLKAFTDAGDEIVGHGGIAIEEVLVPFVTIYKEGT